VTTRLPLSFPFHWKFEVFSGRLPRIPGCFPFLSLPLIDSPGMVSCIFCSVTLLIMPPPSVQTSIGPCPPPSTSPLRPSLSAPLENCPPDFLLPLSLFGRIPFLVQRFLSCTPSCHPFSWRRVSPVPVFLVVCFLLVLFASIPESSSCPFRTGSSRFPQGLFPLLFASQLMRVEGTLIFIHFYPRFLFSWSSFRFIFSRSHPLISRGFSAPFDALFSVCSQFRIRSLSRPFLIFFVRPLPSSVLTSLFFLYVQKPLPFNSR